ncbi:MAG TPA: FtsX-like permease family protein [Micromonosporaceae bacterium]
MTGWTVMVRGIRYRAGRSLVVLLLAAAATTAAVLAPAYTRAAQQSVLTDGLRNAPPSATALVAVAEGTADSAPAAHNATGDARALIKGSLARHPVLNGLVGTGVAGVDADTTIGSRSEPLAARLAYRDNVCANLRLEGECPIDSGQLLVSKRTAEAYGIKVGDGLDLRFANVPGGRAHVFEVVGLYTPIDQNAAYWGLAGYFAGGAGSPEASATRIDAVFTGDEDDVRLESAATVSMRLEYPLRAGEVQLGDVDRVHADLGAVDADLSVQELDLRTELPSILDEVSVDQRAIGRTVPIIAVPLVLLCWFVLFLIVASLVEERGPEIALAKLRGFPAGRAARFGLGEVLLLVVLAAPVGVVAGLGLVELAARSVLAEGTNVEVRWPVFAAAAGALLAAGLAALLAGRRTLRKPVLSLLRRVPARGRWQAGLAEGVVVALAAASLFAALGDRTAPLALLAPPLLAVVAGIAAGRLLGIWSRVRLTVARRRGRIPALLSAAQLARRPAAHRAVVVVTVAVALLAFAATAWDVAAQARRDHAVDTLGADRVYSVTAAHPDALIDAVHGADPSGSSMPVVRSAEQYNGAQVELIGLQAPLLANVVQWRDQNRDQVSGIAAALRPDSAVDPLELDGRVGVQVRVRAVGGGQARLGAIVSVPGEPPTTVSLGLLSRGTVTYSAAVPDCADGCRLIGLSVSRAGASTAPLAVDLDVREVRSGRGPLPARLEDRRAWRALPDRAPGARVVATPGTSLRLTASGVTRGDVVLAHLDAPEALPAVVAGRAPAEDERATEFSFPGFAQSPQPFEVVRRTTLLPRAGNHGLLFDLDYAVRAAEQTASLADSTQLRYEVWANANAPADLDRRLARAGVQVLRTQTMADELDRLGRRAPALGLWLYLLAGGAAVLLAIGVVLLSAYVGADGRRYELAALRVAGVRRRLLRRGVLREQLALLGMPLVVGFAVGVAGAILMLPGIPLVAVDTVQPEVRYEPGLGALPAAVAVSVVGLAFAVIVVLRTLRRATPDRLREDAR